MCGSFRFFVAFLVTLSFLLVAEATYAKPHKGARAKHAQKHAQKHARAKHGKLKHGKHAKQAKRDKQKVKRGLASRPNGKKAKKTATRHSRLHDRHVMGANVGVPSKTLRD